MKHLSCFIKENAIHAAVAGSLAAHKSQAHKTSKPADKRTVYPEECVIFAFNKPVNDIKFSVKLKLKMATSKNIVKKDKYLGVDWTNEKLRNDIFEYFIENEYVKDITFVELRLNEKK